MPTLHKVRPIAISALVFVGVLGLTLSWEPARTEPEAARLTISGGPRDLIARGWVDTNRVAHGGQVHFWVSFQNLSGRDVEDLRLEDFRRPGFKRQGACWKADLPSCVEGAASLPTKLKPGDTVTLSGDLRAEAWSGRYSLFAVFSWKAPAVSGRIRRGLALGPIDVTWQANEWVFGIVRRLYTAAKDLGLPIALALLTYLLQIRDRQRDEAQRRLETQRARIQKLADERRAERERVAADRRVQVQQTWNQLLQKHLRDSQRYYMKIAAGMQELRRVVEQNNPVLREVFYSLLMAMRKVKSTTDSIGGVHFKSRTAESVVAEAYFLLRRGVEAEFGTTDRSAALDAIQATETLAQFEERLAAKPALFLRLENKLQPWLINRNLGDTLSLAEIIQVTIEFETNRPFEYWYEDSEAFPSQTLSDALDRLQNKGELAAIVPRYVGENSLKP